MKPSDVMRSHGGINKAIRHYVPAGKKTGKRVAVPAGVSQSLAFVSSALAAFVATKPGLEIVKKLPYLTVRLADHPEFAKVRRNGTVVVALRRYETTSHFHLVPSTLRVVK